jgi:hypothetical protein
MWFVGCFHRRGPPQYFVFPQLRQNIENKRKYKILGLMVTERRCQREKTKRDEANKLQSNKKTTMQGTI